MALAVQVKPSGIKVKEVRKGFFTECFSLFQTGKIAFRFIQGKQSPDITGIIVKETRPAPCFTPPADIQGIALAKVVFNVFLTGSGGVKVGFIPGFPAQPAKGGNHKGIP